jgi:acyl dehydratase
MTYGEATPRPGVLYSGRLTVTEAHLVMASGMFGDYASIYVDQQFAASTAHGNRTAPASLIAGIMAGVLGKALSTSLLGVLEQRAVFSAPVYPGDTLATEWKVLDELTEESGQAVRLSGIARNQRGETVATAAIRLRLAVA